jgi:hypothetical protein
VISAVSSKFWRAFERHSGPDPESRPPRAKASGVCMKDSLTVRRQNMTFQRQKSPLLFVQEINTLGLPLSLIICSGQRNNRIKKEK